MPAGIVAIIILRVTEKHLVDIVGHSQHGFMMGKSCLMK